MNVQPTTITQKGQVTIPASVRKLLHLQSGDQVEFVVTNKKEVRIKPAKRFSIMSLYGSLKQQIKVKAPSGLTDQQLIKWESDKAHEAWAKEAKK